MAVERSPRECSGPRTEIEIISCGPVMVALMAKTAMAYLVAIPRRRPLEKVVVAFTICLYHAFFGCVKTEAVESRDVGGEAVAQMTTERRGLIYDLSRSICS